MSQLEISQLLQESSFTYDDYSIIGSSCQHIHKPRLSDSDILLILHLITLTSSPFNALAIYSIFKKSAVNMGNLKWCLLNLQVWTALTDFMVAALVVPRFFFPVIGGKALGSFGDVHFGIPIPMQIYIGFGCCGGMIASVAVLFIQRHQAVVGFGHPLKLTKLKLILVLALNYLLYVNMTLPAIFTAPEDQLNTKIEILTTESCPPKDLLDPNVFLLQASLHLLFPYLCFLIVFVGFECGLLALHCSWLLFFSTLTQNLSRKTRKMQIKFLFALFAQIAIPTTLCYAPIFYCVITTLIDHYWQFANDICVFIFATHGMISAICLLLFYDCYRHGLLYLFCRVTVATPLLTVSERTSRKDSMFLNSRKTTMT